MNGIGVSTKLLITAFLFSSAASRLAMGGTIIDGFEAPAISPIWTASGPGTETLTNTVSHSGSQSVFFQVSPTFPWFAQLTHDFGSEVFGSVSVFMVRPIGPSSSAGAIEIDDLGTDLADIQQTPGGSYIARVRPGPSETDFTFTGSSPNSSNCWRSIRRLRASRSGLTVRSSPPIRRSQPSSL